MTVTVRNVIAGLTLAFTAHTCIAQHVMCGLGLPPGSVGYEEWSAKTERQRQTLGYLLVCDANLERYRFDAQTKIDRSVRSELAFEPHSLGGSLFNEMLFLGSIADGFGDKGAAMYRRVFRGAHREIVTLQEMSLRDGASVRNMRDDGFLRLRGTDAQLTTVQTKSGKGFTQLAWQEDSTYFEVTIDLGVDGGRSKERMIELAQSLPTYQQSG
jgi:hypothetical protein